ncbi:hypothetical protein [Streptomyces sp. V1I1]|nr:hypothetical protein [Streptomyces sp. V1I1]MDQ0938700.1 outer membrane receptor for monomeric catechols [Streptomyces sp. V1I1]
MVTARSESRALTAFAAVDAPGTEVVLEYLAVTEQQIADYGLPTAPPKAQ